VDLLAIEIPRRGTQKEASYAYQVAKVVYTKAELTHGVFADPNRPNARLIHVPLDDEDRLATLKEAVCRKFEHPLESVEMFWNKLRPQLNKRLASVRTNNKKRKDRNKGDAEDEDEVDEDDELFNLY
jgi:hypothetical protein